MSNKLIIWSLFVSVLMGSCYGFSYGFVAFDAELAQNKFFIPGNDFYLKVLKWDELKLASFKFSALSFLKAQFGLEPANPGLNYSLVQLNPAADMRTLLLPNEAVPQAGYKTLWGSYMVTVVDEQGITLGGKFPGMTVPLDTKFFVGHWFIKRYHRAAVMINLQTSQPPIIKPGGISEGYLDISSTAYGNGYAFQKNVEVSSEVKVQAKYHAILNFD